MYLDDVYWGWHKDGESLDTFRKFFRHARFKKGSTTTVQNSYQPTAGEVQLAQASADYAKKVAPNAYFLNDVARSLLQDSLGTVQVDFNGMNNTAQRNLGQALGAMQGLAQKNDAVTRAANGQLGSIAGRTGQLAERNAGLLGSLIGGYNAATQGANADLGGARNSMWDSMNRANGVLGQTGNTVGRAADAANSQLGWAGRTGLDAASRANADIGGARGSMWDSMNRANGVLGQVGNTVGQAADAANGQLGWAGRTGLDAATQANGVLGQAGNTVGQAADAANGQLGWAGRASLGASNAANGLLGSLANGVLPTAYQQNMEGSIRSALTNTIGKTIDSLGQRGVLNSSVTTGAMNDIERNASDAVARQYQQNISQVAGLAQQQNQNATAAARDWANYAQQQNANTANAANARANYAQQQNANTMAAAQNWANMAQQQNQNTANAANAQANYAQQQNANTTSAARDWANMAQQQNQNTTAAAQNWAQMAQQQNANTANAAGMQAQMAQQQNANTTNAAQQWANLAQQRNANQFQLANALQNLYNTQYSQLQGALGQQANLAQQQWSNAQGNNSQNSGLYSNLANMAGSPIALAAAGGSTNAGVQCLERVDGLERCNDERARGYRGQGDEYTDDASVGRRRLLRRSSGRRFGRRRKRAWRGTLLLPDGDEDRDGGRHGKAHRAYRGRRQGHGMGREWRGGGRSPSDDATTSCRGLQSCMLRRTYHGDALAAVLDGGRRVGHARRPQDEAALEECGRGARSQLQRRPMGVRPPSVGGEYVHRRRFHRQGRRWLDLERIGG